MAERFGKKAVAAAGLLLLTVTAGTARAGCSGAVTPLHALGALQRPQRVEVRGVVTAVYPALQGFFLEAPRIDWDADDSTPEAVFVYRGRHTLSATPGARVALSARYQHFHGVPELARVRRLVHCGDTGLPTAVTLRFPLAPGVWRAYLGMRVQIQQALTVGDLDDFVHYGEVRVSAGGRHYAPTALT
ncbi:MAG: hypothetical protein WCB49_00995, partial [Gammaproteobacteria bacterium]